ncbi:MAG: hypothetical protein NC548_47515 [Lachnospiraceae bacterium]|nr:hypothetical protein [Lachnospiraceae bacterium]
MKKYLGSLIFMVAIMLFGPVALTGISNAATDATLNIKVTGYDAKVDYTIEMNKCLEDGSPYAIQMGRIYEQQRNLKIDGLGWGNRYKKTYWFQNATTAAEVRAAMEADKKPKYTDEDLYWLSRCVNAEMGCDWMPDWVQRATASVVINNANSLGTSIRGAVFSGKYGCANNGAIYKTPTKKVTENCRYVLENGITVPAYVIGQSGWSDVYGPIYTTYYDPVLRTTTYFWYTKKY